MEVFPPNEVSSCNDLMASSRGFVTTPTLPGQRLLRGFNNPELPAKLQAIQDDQCFASIQDFSFKFDPVWASIKHEMNILWTGLIMSEPKFIKKTII